MGLLRTAVSGGRPRNSHAEVVNRIGLAIVRGSYPVGEILPGDADLAETFGVSRTVLREAMRTLSAKGMIVPRAGVGTRVVDRSGWNLLDSDVLAWHLEGEVDIEFLGHLYDMRLCVEPGAARLAAARATPEEAAELIRLADRMGGAESREAFAMADLDFHMAFLDATRNPFMRSVGTLIEAALATTFRRSAPADAATVQASAAAHRRIAEAIRDGDGTLAAEATRGVIIFGRTVTGAAG